MSTFDELRQKVDDISQGQDVQNIEALKRIIDRIEAKLIDANVTALTETVDQGAGTADVAKVFDRKVRVTIDEQDYWIGMYDV